MTQADLKRVEADLERLRAENGGLCGERDALVKEMMTELKLLGGLEKELGKEILARCSRLTCWSRRL